MFLIIGALGAIGTGLKVAGAIGGLLGGRKRQGQADKLNAEAIGMTREEDRRREPLRQAANQHLLGPLGVNPASNIGPSARFTAQAGQADAAAGRVAGFGGLGPFQSVAPGQASNLAPARGMLGRASREFNAARLLPAGSEATRARSLAAGQLEDTVGAPSRQEIALTRFQNLLDQTEDERTQGVRSIGQSAAKFGRLGSGMVTTDLGNLEDRLQTNLVREARGLAADTAAQEEQDRLARLGITLDAAGQFRGEDFREGSTRADLALRRGSSFEGLGRDITDLAQVEFGQGAHLRNEARDERDALTDHRLRGLDADRAILSDLSQREGQTFGQDFDERGFLDHLYQSGLDNRLAFGSTLAGIGYRPPDTGTLMQGANAQAQAAQQSTAGGLDALGEIFRSRAGAGSPLQLGDRPRFTPRVAPVGPVSLAPIGRGARRITG